MSNHKFLVHFNISVAPVGDPTAEVVARRLAVPINAHNDREALMQFVHALVLAGSCTRCGSGLQARTLFTPGQPWETMRISCANCGLTLGSIS